MKIRSNDIKKDISGNFRKIIVNIYSVVVQFQIWSTELYGIENMLLQSVSFSSSLWSLNIIFETLYSVVHKSGAQRYFWI